MCWSWLLILGLAGTLAAAQETNLESDFRGEHKRVSEACGAFSFKSVPGCAYELFTDHPLHIAAGSMPAQNGFALGAAFVDAKNPGNWRLSWDLDAVGSSNGSWRAGGYMKIIHTPNQAIKIDMPVMPQPGESAPPKKPVKKHKIDLTHPDTVFNLYAQSISLNKLYFFGLGNDSGLAGESVFAMTQTTVGANAVKPVYEWDAITKLKLAFLAEVNGRFVNVRGDNGQSTPSIETLYTNATAPGLRSQPGFVQLGEGFRVDPVLFKDHFELNYGGNFQEFFAPSSSMNSFLRWTADLNHTYYLYGYTRAKRVNTDASGPDECTANGAASDAKCPKVPLTPNRSGFITARLLVSESINSATSAVPFYFQQTLGGADIDGNMSLGSYQDYRFRAPNLLLLQQSFEHSLWGPFGFKFMTDEGRVALTRGDLGFSHLRHSFAAGLTLRAGGFPMVSLMFAWGGPEGHHNIFNMNSSLLGGSARPLLD